jgi:hypothetical protein
MLHNNLRHIRRPLDLEPEYPHSVPAGDYPHIQHGERIWNSVATPDGHVEDVQCG